MRVRVFVCIVVLLLLLRRHVMQASLQAGLSSMRRCSSCNAAQTAGPTQRTALW
jgi:hypothetical protein